MQRASHAAFPRPPQVNGSLKHLPHIRRQHQQHQMVTRRPFTLVEQSHWVWKIKSDSWPLSARGVGEASPRMEVGVFQARNRSCHCHLRHHTAAEGDAEMLTKVCRTHVWKAPEANPAPRNTPPPAQHVLVHPAPCIAAENLNPDLGCSDSCRKPHPVLPPKNNQSGDTERLKRNHRKGEVQEAPRLLSGTYGPQAAPRWGGDGRQRSFLLRTQRVSREKQRVPQGCACGPRAAGLCPLPRTVHSHGHKHEHSELSPAS